MKLFYLLPLLLLFLMVEGISEFVLCDCNRPATKGIIDYSLPTYCTEKTKNATIHTALYSLYSTEPIRTTLKATMCERWEKVLTIRGTFWIGSYDTERTQFTVPVSAEECRRMKNSNKCGTGIEEHTMVESRGSHTYIAEPKGEGQWMRDNVYRTVNCQLRSITLWQETPSGPVMSPFGKLADNVLDRSAVVNHNTIIWDIPASYQTKCDPIRFKEGEGKIIRTTNTARLEDTKDQIAFTYNIDVTHICSHLPVHQIEGLPNAYVYIYDTEGNNTDKADGPVIPSRTGRSLSSSSETTLSTDKELDLLDKDTKHQLNTIALTRYYWGRIQPVVERDQVQYKDFLSTGRNNDSLLLHHEITTDEPIPWEDFNQEFELNIDHTLRRINTNRCVVVDLERIVLSDCTRPTRWTYEAINYLLVDLQTGLCLSFLNHQIVMRSCDRKSRKAHQMWRFEFRNVHPTFYTEASIGTNEEFRHQQEEIVTATSTDKFNADAFAYGRLILHTTTGTIHGICLTTLPRAYSQVYPLFCANDFDGKHIQKLQLMPDQTIRPFSGRYCLNRVFIAIRGGLARRLTTGPCSPASLKWFQLQSNQLAAIDLTNLEITPECLTRTVYPKETVLELKPCLPEIRLPESQQLWYFDRKETLMGDRFTLHDISSILTHFQSLSKLTDETKSERLKLWMDFRPDRGTAFGLRLKNLFDGLDNIVSHNDQLRLVETSTKLGDTITPPINVREDTPSNETSVQIPKSPDADLSTSQLVDLKTEPKQPTPTGLTSATISKHESDSLITQDSLIPPNLQVSSTEPSEPIPPLLHRIARQNQSSKSAASTADGSSDNAVPVTPPSSSSSSSSASASSASAHNVVTEPSVSDHSPDPNTSSSSSDRNTVSAKTTETDTASTSSTDKSNVSKEDLDEFVRKMLLPLHEDWKQQMELDHENLLAQETQQLYCELLKVKHSQLIVSSQWSGLLAAKSLKFDTCSKLTNVGQSLLLQECKPITVKISALESRCGFQPYFQYNSANLTVGRDGLSLHPFDECFWNSHLIPISDKTYFWRHDGNISNGDWIEQKGTIPLHGLALISGFQHTILKDYDYELRSHYAHEQQFFEPLNILSEIMGHLQGEEESSISNLIFSQKKEVDIGNLFSWTNTLKIGFLVFVAIIAFALLIQFFRLVLPRIRSYRPTNTSIAPEDIPMLPRPYNPVIYTPASPPVGVRPRNRAHKHDKCVTIEGLGLVYEGCNCPCA